MPDQTLAEALQQITLDLVDNLSSEDFDGSDTEEIARKAIDAAANIGIQLGRRTERNRTQVLLKAQFFDG